MNAEEYDYGPFKVGDVVEIYNVFGKNAFLNGRQIEILGPLETHCGILVYEVDVPELKTQPDQRTFAETHHVRRLRPRAQGEQMIRAMFDAPPQPQPVPEVA